MENITIIRDFGQSNMPKDVVGHLDQEFLIKSLIESEHFINYPPPPTYRRRFWKLIIQIIESREEEVDERIYSHYLQLLPPSSYNPLAISAAPASGYTTYLIKPPPETIQLLGKTENERPVVDTNEFFSVTLLESRKTIEQGTTGLRTWQPSLMLADWLLRNPDEVRGDVLELGCGIGLLGVITAMIQNTLENPDSYSLCLSDIDEGVLTQCRRNVRIPANGLKEGQRQIDWTLIDWQDALPSAENRPALESKLKKLNPTIILGADLVYELSIIPALGCILEMLMTCLPKIPTVILTVTVRRQATMDTFLETLGKYNLKGFVYQMRPFEETVFAGRQYDVDEGTIIRLVRVFKLDGL